MMQYVERVDRLGYPCDPRSDAMVMYIRMVMSYAPNLLQQALGNGAWGSGQTRWCPPTGDFSLATGGLFVGGWQVGILGNGPRGRGQERLPDGWHVWILLLLLCYSTTGKWGCTFVGNASYELAEYSLSLSKYIHPSYQIFDQYVWVAEDGRQRTDFEPTENGTI